MVYEITLKKITKENFFYYGKYYDESERIPNYSDSSFDWWNAVGIIDIQGRTSLGVVKSNFNSEFSEQVFEQHNNTPEVLIPIDDDVILLLGKEQVFCNEIPSKGDFEAFQVPRGKAVSINPGVWHHAPMTLKNSVKT